ncbi:MAG: hypothetical protein IPK82_39420 [Polyangiaceae bacterium]|nr:hypothetical protein [Polyangiaceae bacterium]
MTPAPNPMVSAEAPRHRARALRTQAFRVTAALCRARLSASGQGRFARFIAGAIAVGAIAIAISLRADDGPAVPMGGLLRKTAGTLAWICGGALALAAARDSRAADRSDGIDALVAARGITSNLLAGARTLAASTQIGFTVGVPAALVAIATAGLAADVSSALRRIAAAFALLAWGGITGVVLGSLAALSARFFGNRGPTALVAIVIGERIAVEALGLGAWSIPGLLRAALSLLLGLTGVGGGL